MPINNEMPDSPGTRTCPVQVPVLVPVTVFEYHDNYFIQYPPQNSLPDGRTDF